MAQRLTNNHGQPERLKGSPTTIANQNGSKAHQPPQSKSTRALSTGQVIKLNIHHQLVPKLRMHTAEPQVLQMPSRHGAVSTREHLYVTNSHNTDRVELTKKIQSVSEPRLRHMRKTHQASHPF
jgi:hypothetical protein